MPHRFQFSLARAFTSIGLLCVALVTGRLAVSLGNLTMDGPLLACVTGVIVAAAVGVFVGRWASFSMGAVIGIGTCVACVLGMAYVSGRFR